MVNEMEFDSSFEGEFVLLNIPEGTWCGLCFFNEDKTKVAIYDGDIWMTVDEFLGVYTEDPSAKPTEKELYLIDVGLIKLDEDDEGNFWDNPVKHFINEFGMENYQKIMKMKDNPPEWLSSEEDHSGMVFNPYTNRWSFL